jgi:threonine dehydrogenase-like Zn-dependent dehydrogenase
MLAKAMGAQMLVGVDTVKERCELAREKKLADHVFLSGESTLKDVRALTFNGQGFERTIDCSGNTTEGSLQFVPPGNGEKWPWWEREARLNSIRVPISSMIRLPYMVPG